MDEFTLSEQIEALLEIEAYDEVVDRLTLDPVPAATEFKFAWSLGWACYRLGRFATAVDALKRATEMDPIQPVGHFALGVAYEQLGQLDKAESSLRRSLELGDSDMTRQALAVVLMERGAYKEAEAVHREGLEIEPDSADRWEGYADFLSDAGREREAMKARAKASALRQKATRENEA